MLVKSSLDFSLFLTFQALSFSFKYNLLAKL
jgi:hypothetical protein